MHCRIPPLVHDHVFAMPDSANGQNGPQYRLPIEIWREIFEITTTAVGKDEFAVDAIMRSQCDQRGESGLPSLDEESGLIKRRLVLVHVCRYWHDTGISLLWSHLRIGANLPKSSVLQILRNLRRKDSYALSVRRLTIYSWPKRDKHWHESMIDTMHNIISILPRLEVLRCPLSYISETSEITANVVILDKSWYKPQTPSLLTTSLYNGLQILSIDFKPKGSNLVPYRDVYLPKLRHLHISADDPISELVTRYWRAPVLSHLSLEVPLLATWFEFLEQCSQNLETLELIGFMAVSTTRTRREIELPKLDILYFYQTSWLHMNVIRSRSLRLLGLSQCYHHRSDLDLSGPETHWFSVKESWWSANSSLDTLLEEGVLVARPR